MPLLANRGACSLAWTCASSRRFIEMGKSGRKPALFLWGCPRKRMFLGSRRAAIRGVAAGTTLTSPQPLASGNPATGLVVGTETNQRGRSAPTARRTGREAGGRSHDVQRRWPDQRCQRQQLGVPACQGSAPLVADRRGQLKRADLYGLLSPPFLLFPQGTFAGRAPAAVGNVGAAIDFLPQPSDALSDLPQQALQRRQPAEAQGTGRRTDADAIIVQRC
jgi:hypothetical protein